MHVIPYAEWCDVPFNRTPNQILLKQSQIWLHHGAAGTSTIPTARRYAADHAARAGWAGLAYSWLIADGQVLEGRGPGREGAHTQGRNRKSYGICMVGNYSHRALSQQDVDALVWLLQHGHTQGWFEGPQLTGGHRDVVATACPGAAAYKMITEINRKATEVITPQPAPTQRNIDDDIRRIRISLRAIGNALGVPVDLDGPTDGTTVIT